MARLPPARIPADRSFRHAVSIGIPTDDEPPDRPVLRGWDVRLASFFQRSRRCPPEDCGGVHGYAEFLEAIVDPKHPDYEQMREWAGPFDPDDFNPAKVKFDDPEKRWKKAFRDA